jgi:hypothetical protein
MTGACVRGAKIASNRPTVAKKAMQESREMRLRFPLLSSMNIKFGMAAALLGVFGLIAAPLANATPISFYNDAGNQDTLRFTLGCGSSDGSCSGLIEVLESESPTSWGDGPGDVFDLGNSGDATELGFVNTVTGENFTAGMKLDGNGGSESFSISGEYVLIKIGNKYGLSYAFIHNLGGSLDVFLSAMPGQGAGLSHYTQFGTPTVGVPEPAELGMLGFGLLLIGGFVGLRRRYN